MVQERLHQWGEGVGGGERKEKSSAKRVPRTGLKVKIFHTSGCTLGRSMKRIIVVTSYEYAKATRARVGVKVKVNGDMLS